MDVKRVWAIRAGNAGQADALFIDQNLIAMSSADVDDDVGKLSASRSAFKQAYDPSITNVRPEAVPILAGQLFRFVHEVKIGDYVVYPRKSDRTLRWGEIAGPYVFHSDGSSDFSHRRSVIWNGKAGRDLFSQGALYELGSTLTLFEVKSFADEIIEKFSGVAAGGLATPQATREEDTETVVRDVVEATRDFISKKLRSELKGYPLEPFVADLFRSMGYRAHTTRKVKDDGIDIVAHRDELGIEPPVLKIQVKAQDANIGADCVKAFYAMVQDRDVGIFVSTGGYSSSARDFARTKGNLKLVDGVDLVELIQKYYDGLEQKFRRQIPLRRVLIPDVAFEDA